MGESDKLVSSAVGELHVITVTVLTTDTFQTAAGIHLQDYIAS
jgi:hypothetical protein